MKLLNKLTWKHLKLNKKRTFVTIVGIILATALLSAVAAMVTSYQHSLIEYQKTVKGDFHYSFAKVPADEIGKLENNRNFESYYETVGIGYANLEGSVNKDKPYLYLEAMDTDAMKNSTIQLTEGRLPKNDGEILISKHIKTNGGVTYKVGDTLTIDLSERLYDGEEDELIKKGQLLGQDMAYTGTEKLQSICKKTYKIVGITERLSFYEEDRLAPGYTIITKMEKGKIDVLPHVYDGVKLFARYTKEALKKRYQITAEILGIDGALFQKYVDSECTNEEFETVASCLQKTYLSDENTNLINYECMDGRDDTLNVLYTLAGIVLLIIVVTSAFCIRNSFSISITEKTKQYGMLASVGATPKQIRKNVYYEAALLGGIGIPIGVGSGLLACLVLMNIVNTLIGEMVNVEFAFVVSWQAVGISILFAMLMIYLSARKPAKRAAKVSPIVAMNGSQDIKLTAKKLRVPAVISKIFGISGKIAYKNRKRNKKKYRVVILSITVSVAAFLALYSFMGLMMNMTKAEYEEDYNLSFTLDETDDSVLKEKIPEISNMDGVKRMSICREFMIAVLNKDLPFTEEAKQIYTVSEEEKSQDVRLISVGEAEYEQYTKEIGVDAKEMENKVILINQARGQEEPSGKMKYFKYYNFKVGDTFTAELYDNKEAEPKIEKEETLTIGAITDKYPMGLENQYEPNAYMIVSETWMDAHKQYWDGYVHVSVDCEDADSVQETIAGDSGFGTSYIYNAEKTQRENKAFMLLVAIFLYGFIAVISLIGITNIFNTVTTSMEVRSREFATLQSIGMTPKQFRNMVTLECIFYGVKALFWGLLVGTGLSYLIYHTMAQEFDMGFTLPLKGMGISVAAVVILLGSIMYYSLAQIKKQNIIETIRQENV